MYKKNGEKKYFCINAANFRLDGGAMFGIIPKPLWEKKMAPDCENRINMALRLQLIQTNSKNILIDTGIGDYHGEKFDKRFDIRSPSSPLEVALKEINLTPSNITDLILSHLHFDHVGGIIKFDETLGQMVSVFKNATIHLHRKHYNYSQNPTPRDSGSFHKNDFLPCIKEAIANQKIHWIEGEQGDIIPEIQLKFLCSHGHTPFMIHPYDQNTIYMADIIPTSSHLPIPWVMGYDISPGITSIEKEKFLNFIKDKNLFMIFEHDPKYCGGKISFDQQKGFTLKDLILQKLNQRIQQIFVTDKPE